MAPGAGGTVFAVIAVQLNELQPHPLQARTQTFPELLPTVTVIEVVGEPDIIQPAGTVQV